MSGDLYLTQALAGADLARNEAAKARLVELVRSGNAVLFAGAGLSIPVGYPSWAGLLEELEKLGSESGFVGDAERRTSKPLAYVDEIKAQIQKAYGSLDRYNSFLYRTFEEKSKRFSATQSLVVRLPAKGILTTNFDPSLVLALPDGGPTSTLVITSPIEASDFVHALDWPQSRRKVAHLHGSYREFEKIVLSEADYFRCYGELGGQQPATWTLHRKLLWALLATRHIVFLGFSFEDPAFQLMLQLVQRDLWRWDASEQHFAIMGVAAPTAGATLARAAQLRREFGVQVAFYEIATTGPDRHIKFDHLITEIAAACNVTGEAAWIDKTNAKGLANEN